MSSNIFISPSVSGKASTVRSAALIGQARWFSLAEILAPPQYLLWGLCSEACTCWRECSRESCGQES